MAFQLGSTVRVCKMLRRALKRSPIPESRLRLKHVGLGSANSGSGSAPAAPLSPTRPAGNDGPTPARLIGWP
eukprot:4964412-Alexandrium_andersonii.AAC.1